jgi:hypothetical protein
MAARSASLFPTSDDDSDDGDGGGGRWVPAVPVAVPAAAAAVRPRAPASAPVLALAASTPDAAGDAEDEEDDVLGLAYDEDLSVNPFMRALQSKHAAALWAEATAAGATVCVPCAPSLEGVTLTADEVASHVLVPAAGGAARDERRTANGRLVRLERAHVKTLVAFPSRTPRRPRILFEETYYNARSQPYRVVCLEYPLDGGPGPGPGAAAGGSTGGAATGFSAVAVQLRTVADCRAYLWAEVGAMDGRRLVEEVIASARPSLMVAASPTAEAVLAAVAAAYQRALPVLLRTLPPRAARDPAVRFVRLALETHLVATLHDAIDARMAALYASDDALINKVGRHSRTYTERERERKRRP